MDRRTYDLLCARVDYLELVANVYQRSDRSVSFLGRLAAVHKNLDEFIKTKYPEFLRIEELCKQYGFWKSLGNIEDTRDIHDVGGIQTKRLVLLSNYDYLVKLVGSMQKLVSLDPHKVLTDKFPVDIVSYKQIILRLTELLVSDVVPNKYNRLLVNSIAFLETYTSVINEYNQQYSFLRNKLATMSIEVSKRNFARQRHIADNSY